MTVLWTKWLLLFAQLAVLLVLVYGSWRALFGDRGRGRRRCPTCWYDMSWTADTTCPECGASAKSEKALLRVRRRPVMGLACIIGASALGLWSIDGVWTRGWTSYMPDRVLVWLVPFDEGFSGPIRSELDLRMRRNQLGDGTWIALLERATSGFGDATPGTAEWDTQYRDLLGQSARRLLGHEDPGLRATARDELHELLQQELPTIELTSREVWPSGMTPAIDVHVQDWIQLPMPIRVTLTPRIDVAHPDVHERWGQIIQRRAYTLFLPVLEDGDHEVLVDARIERRRDGDAPWERAGEFTVPVAFSVGGAAMTPRVDPALDDEVRRIFAGGVVKWESGSLPIRVNVNARSTFAELFDDTAFGARVEVRRNGIAARVLEIWWKCGVNVNQAGRQHAWEVPMLHDDVMRAPHTANDEWTVHVASVTEIAHRVDGASMMWQGEFDLVIPVTPREGPAPSRGWVPETLADGDGTWPAH